MKVLLFLALLIPAAARAQWVQVATYNQVPIAVNAGTYLRYGPTAGPWFVKWYPAAKTITSWTAEFTTNPVPGGDVSTYVLAAFNLPLASNTSPQTITVAGKSIPIPAASNSNTVIVPPNSNTTVHFTISATCDGTITAAICR